MKVGVGGVVGCRNMSGNVLFIENWLLNWEGCVWYIM